MTGKRVRLVGEMKRKVYGRIQDSLIPNNAHTVVEAAQAFLHPDLSDPPLATTLPIRLAASGGRIVPYCNPMFGPYALSLTA